MNYEYTQTDFSRGILSGLFAGLVATVANIIFVLIFRSVASFYDFIGLDITVLIFGSVVQSIACGWVFYICVHFLKKGIISYRLIVILITAAIFFLGIIVRRSVMGSVTPDFKFMVTGTQVIIGGIADFFIPYLFSHDKIIS